MVLLTGQRAVIGGEALNATFGPVTCPPTNSATSNAAASKLPPITAKKPMLDLWCAIFPLLHDSYPGMKAFRGSCCSSSLLASFV
jgi:hypothetical protein